MTLHIGKPAVLLFSSFHSFFWGDASFLQLLLYIVKIDDFRCVLNSDFVFKNQINLCVDCFDPTNI